MAFTVTDPASPVASLARVFEISYGRPIGEGGLAFWGNAIEDGSASLVEVAEAITRTREFYNRYDDDQTDAEFVARLFEEAYGREGGAAGIAFYEARLAGGATRGEVVAAFARSAEAAAKIDVLGAAGLEVPDPAGPGAFRYGVASGDPDATSVVLWTHARPAGAEGPVDVGWEVSETPDFATVVDAGTVTTSAAEDYTVKAIADGLDGGTTYYYRFSVDGETSQTGTTQVLPDTGIDALTLAIFSCANYPGGFFNAYAAAAADGFDFSVFLGDYIYEYGIGEYATGRSEEFDRVPRPFDEIVTAADYNTRYAQYHTDKDLQAVRAENPMIMMWDDHETTNDSWEFGAENHDPATEGDWETRRDVALEAFYRWNPVRAPEDDLRDFDKSYDFGDLATLHMLETRLQARDLQLSYETDVPARIGEYLADDTGATFAGDVALFPELVPEGLDPTDPATLAALSQDEAFVQALAVSSVVAEMEFGDREMIGADQLAELEGRIDASDADWQIVGSQTLMNRMYLPAPLLLDPATLPSYLEIFAKLGAGAPLTAEEQALLDAPAIPYNPDAWDGYGAEREAILQLLADKGPAAVIAGDTHNAWFGELVTRDGALAAVEFGGPGVSSPGLEDFLAGIDPALVAGVFTGAIPTLSYADTALRGYMSMEIGRDAISTDYVFADRVDSVDYEVVTHTETVGIELFA